MKQIAYDNPYWDIIKNRLGEVLQAVSVDILQSGMYDYSRSLWAQRKDFCSTYSWAIPDPATLDFLAEWLAPSAIEIGAGTGYFAWQMQQRGVAMAAYDIAPPHMSAENEYHSPRDTKETHLLGTLRDIYFPVEMGGPEVVEQYPERALFLCWPPYSSDMAAQCLQSYRGNRLIYIGEGSGGCNADDAFFETLEQEWHEVAFHSPIQWDAIHDYVQVFERGAEEHSE